MANNNKRKGTKHLFFVTAALAITLLTVLSMQFSVLKTLDHKFLDFRFQRFNQNNPVSQDILFVDVDDVSLQTLSDQIGGWPWPRGSVVADLIVNYVLLGNPSAFMFDVVYSELSPKRPDEPISDEDLWLADVSMLYPEVSHAVLFTNENLGVDAQLPPFTDQTFAVPIRGDASIFDFPTYDFVFSPYDPLFSSANALHSVNHIEDTDGISRQNQLLVKFQDQFYPGIAVRSIMKHRDIEEIRFQDRMVELVDPDGTVLAAPLRRNGTYQLNFYPDLNAFEAYPADNIIASAQNFFSGNGEVLVPPETFENKIIVFGASALGLKDIKVTPMGKNVPGPYLHMTAISNILQGQHLMILPTWAGQLLAVLLIVAVLAVTVYIPRGALRALIGAAIVVVWILVTLLAFQQAGLVLEMATTGIALILAYLGGVVFSGLLEAMERNRISTAMGKYLAPTVMNEVLENYQELVGEVGRNREITILFSDIRSFSSISEQYDAPTVVTVLNQYLEAMIGIVFEYRGTLDKMIGDAIMAFWGAPNAEQDKEKLAVGCAVNMIQGLYGVNEQLTTQGLPNLKIGVGVHTGEMIVGNIGSAQRLDYTAIGDNVNLGSRLEGLTKYYKAPVLVSETTYAAFAGPDSAPAEGADGDKGAQREPSAPSDANARSGSDYRFLFLDRVAVKGKKTGVGIYSPANAIAPRGTDPDALEAACLRFEEAHALYDTMDFTAAGKAFSAIQTEAPEPVAGMATVFAERCEELMQEPPEPGWDGVWTMKSK